MLLEFLFGPSQTHERIEDANKKLDALWVRLTYLENNIMSALDGLIAKVREQGDVVSSAIVLIHGLRTELVDVKTKLASAGVDPALIDGLTSELDSYGDRLAEAVAANTVAEAPAQPAVEPVMEPEAEPAPEVVTEEPQV